MTIWATDIASMAASGSSNNQYLRRAKRNDKRHEGFTISWYRLVRNRSRSYLEAIRHRDRLIADMPLHPSRNEAAVAVPNKRRIISSVIPIAGFFISFHGGDCNQMKALLRRQPAWRKPTLAALV